MANFLKKGLLHKSDISGVIDSSGLSKNIETLATQAELKAEKDKILRFEAFGLSYISGKSHSEDD